ncbi:uncharacterized protein PRCAT00005529001 [Priceomyces carsonii]|uniref:uncharacterized protein n=1 Tax=Priceomyces carsonii TaxID=28549 RepID=UPI002EDA555E|nr:unnamed protein product [Priceomyces carsonii]
MKEHGIKKVKLTEEARKAKLEKDKIKIANYRKLTNRILDLRDSGNYSIGSLSETTTLLNINPEFYTVWNFRREILLSLFEKQELDMKQALEEDLQMVLAHLKRFPKCYWIWNHRIWCLGQLQKKHLANWKYELGIVSKLLELDNRNFHGWQYRRYVVDNMEKNLPPDQALVGSLQININELQYTTTKVNKNISNFSAWHNRTKLIPKIYQILLKVGKTGQFADEQIFSDPYVTLLHELELIKTGMYMDADDSSVWLYLRWLLTDELFVNDLKSHHQVERKSYSDILTQQLEVVEELNELEIEDHPQHLDNCWCLKSIVLIKSLINRENKKDLMSDEIKELLLKLIKLDPLREGKYIDQLERKESIIS